MTRQGHGSIEAPAAPELHAVWDSPTTAIVVVDPELRIRSANAAYGHLAQAKPDDLVGKTLWVVAPLTTGVVSLSVAKALETNEAVTGTAIPYNFVELLVDVFPIDARGSDPRAVVVLADTRRKRVDAPSGASGARRGFFEVARRMAWATTLEADRVVTETLKYAGEVYDLDHAYVRLLSDDGAEYAMVFEWRGARAPAVDERIVPATRRGWSQEKLERGEAIVIASLDEMPPEAASFRRDLERLGVGATVGVPLADGPRTLGYVVFSVVEAREWSGAQIDLLRMLGEMIAGLVARVNTEADTAGRLRFEEMMSTQAAAFVDMPVEAIDEGLSRMLSAIGAGSEVDRALIMQLDEIGETLTVSHEWLGPGIESVKGFFSRRVGDLSPVTRRVLAGETIAAWYQTTEPGSDLRELLDRIGIRGVVLAPLYVEGQCRGLLNAQTLRSRRGELSSVRARAQLVADVISAALTRRAVSARLARWERRFSRVLSTAMDGVVLVDRAGDVREWTPQATAVLGPIRAAILDRPFVDLVFEDDRALWASRFAGALEDAAPAQRFELRAVHREGRVVPLEVSMTSLEGSGTDLVALFVRDISDRKLAEAERQRAFDQISQQKRTAERERDYLREERPAASILGESAAILSAIELANAVAPSFAAVLLTGESGVGKEVFAATIHAQSSRSGPFVKVNCASVPASLFESEFFGHVKGSFTGAVRDRVGRFELASAGTLFLDEVGEIPLDLQAKLLRVLQEGEIERVGEDRTRRVDVRILSATNRDLEQEVEAGRFRRDLFFRLSVFPLPVPALRERGADVLLLARHFLARHLARAHREGLALSSDDEKRLRDYDWPGNVRELDHVLERAVILSSRADRLRLDLALPTRSAPPRPAVEELLREEDIRRIERDNIVLALDRAKGRISGPGGAAALLGIRPSTLRDRKRALGIDRDDEP